MSCARWWAQRLRARSDADLVRLAERMGGIFWYLVKRRRQLGLAHLERAFGSRLTLSEREALLRESYTHLALTALCAARRINAPSTSTSTQEHTQEHTQIEGLAYLTSALEQGGVVLVSIHLGDWESLLQLHQLTQREVHLLSKRFRHPLAQALWDASRAGGPVRQDQGPRAKALIKALKRGACVVDVLDQHDPRPKARSLPFFGHLAQTSPDVVLLAERGEAQLLPVVTWRAPLSEVKQGGAIKHTVWIGPPLSMERSPLSSLASHDQWARRDEVLKECLKLFEQHIASHPEQWMWIHRRWKPRSIAQQQRAQRGKRR
jgi:KDO2-lipid IV(A) lauroyltransferase